MVPIGLFGSERVKRRVVGVLSPHAIRCCLKVARPVCRPGLGWRTAYRFPFDLFSLLADPHPEQSPPDDALPACDMSVRRVRGSFRGSLRRYGSVESAKKTVRHFQWIYRKGEWRIAYGESHLLTYH